MRFRLPYQQFLQLVEQISVHDMFIRWHPGRKNGAGKPTSPLSLLLLGSLRYLGRGLTMDDLEEYANINQEVHRVFFTSSLGMAHQ